MTTYDEESPSAGTEFFPRVVVKFEEGDHLPAIRRIQKQFPDVSVGKLFSSLAPQQVSDLVTRAQQSDENYNPVDFTSYYLLECSPGRRLMRLMKALKGEKTVVRALIDAVPAAPPSVSPKKKQAKNLAGHLQPAPMGIDVAYAHSFEGGDGKGSVRLIDVEQGWLTDHEAYCLKTFPLSGINRLDEGEHGAAVLGIISMPAGIASCSNVYAMSPWRPNGSFNNADAIMTAISYLKYGDIILLETQALKWPGTEDLYPLEFRSEIFEVIRLATALGIIVIEAAGNGNAISNCGGDLDLLRVEGKRRLNTHSKDFRDSGAILVAASSSSVPHERADYTNFGTRVDCYAWGEDVVTAGNFPWSSGAALNTYTHEFCGTSSASAIVAGAALVVQSIAEANLSTRLSPKQMRYLLGNNLYGTPSAHGRSKDKIGVMPDLKKIIDAFLKPVKSRNRHSYKAAVLPC